LLLVVEVKSVQVQWRIYNTNNGPDPTSGHSSGLIGNRFFIFGGCESPCCNFVSLSLFSLDTGSGQWSEISQIQNPQHRVYHTITSSLPGDGNPIIVMWGGVNPILGGFLGDFWTFQAPNYQWTGIYPNSAIPSPRAGHSAVIIGTDQSRQFCIYGGRNAAIIYSDLWCYTFANNQWTLVLTSNVPRAFHSSVAYSDATGNNLLIYGGSYDQGTDLSSLWKYNFNSRQFTQVAPNGGIPLGRLGHEALTNQVGGRLYMIVFGGINSYIGYLNDTWAFDVQTNTWSLCNEIPSPDGKAPSRGYFAFSSLDGVNNIVHGGFTTGNRQLSDMWYQNLLP